MSYLALTAASRLFTLMIMRRHVHPDTSGMPQWYAQTVNDAYRKLLDELDKG